MMRCFIRLLVTVTLGASWIGTPVRAEDTTEVFVKNLVAAINSGNAERRKALLHPRTLACANTAPELFFDDALARQARRPIPPTFRWNITEFPPSQIPMFADKFDYPVRPTHGLQIDFEPEPNSHSTIMLQLVREDRQWFEITACPKPETVRAARTARHEREQLAQRVERLVATTPANLKTTVIDLYKQGRKIDAYKYYQSVTGEDLAVSRDVVQRLADPKAPGR